MYVKIYSQVFDSSLAEDYQTRHVFMDLLVLADPEGEVDMTHEAIARRTNVPIAIIRDAIGKLTVSDVNSRSKDHEGKRLIPIDPERNWGWKIVNFRHYRNIKNEAARREYMRTYMAKKRAAERAVSKVVSTGKQNVNISSISMQEANNNDLSSEPKKDLRSEPPSDLKDLELYATDEKLCKAWPKLLVALKQAFPGVDVVAETRKAHAWEVADPARRKTKRTAFLRRWCSTAQDRGGYRAKDDSPEWKKAAYPKGLTAHKATPDRAPMTPEEVAKVHKICADAQATLARAGVKSVVEPDAPTVVPPVPTLTPDELEKRKAEIKRQVAAYQKEGGDGH